MLVPLVIYPIGTVLFANPLTVSLIAPRDKDTPQEKDCVHDLTDITMVGIPPFSVFGEASLLLGLFSGSEDCAERYREKFVEPALEGNLSGVIDIGELKRRVKTATQAPDGSIIETP
jgi:hypothetical protein